MIQTIDEVLRQIVRYKALNANLTQVQKDDYDLLKRWGVSIVDACAELEAKNKLYPPIGIRSIQTQIK